MHKLRRTVLLALAALAARPFAAAAAWSKEAFGAKSAADALRELGAAGAAASQDLVIDAPQIAVLIEKNPFPLAGKFTFMEGAVPFVKLNVKMGETSDVRVVATAAGRQYFATREVKVTIGGCGG